MNTHLVSETTKQTIDMGAVAVTIGTVTQILPAIAAVATIVWTTIRIYETDTVQNYLKKFRKEE